MSKKVLTAIIIVGALIAVGVFLFASKKDPGPAGSKQAGGYCGSDGTLVDVMPIQSHRSYCLRLDALSPFAFSIIDDQGNTLKDFAVTHTKVMHVIVVRNDLKHFQHVHPAFDSATGVFALPALTFPADGVYRIFADFVPKSGQMGVSGMPLPVTISTDVAVGIGSRSDAEPIGGEERAKTFAGINVMLAVEPQPIIAGVETRLTFNLSKDGTAITDLEDYLGARGHSVILREGSLDFIHTHPIESVVAQDGKVRFAVTLPLAGKYKIFSEFQRDGQVFTSDFVVSASDGMVTTPTEGQSMIAH